MTAALDSVVGHHVNPFRSGVARFNELLAEALRIPLVPLSATELDTVEMPLLSFKVGELEEDAKRRVSDLLDRLGEGGWQLFLHDLADDPLQRRLVADAGRVWCGNEEITACLGAVRPDAVTLWAPGLVLDDRRFEPAAISVFSFGMAHKMRIDKFERLKALLEAGGRSYAIYISNANHETSTIEDAQLVYEEMHRVFPRGLYFMGNMSDVAVFNHLQDTTFFAAFFRDGARANNTSIQSAMEHGAVVITNLDAHSPANLIHLENVIDINACDELPLDQLTLRRISVAAMETAADRSWDKLAAAMRGA